MTQTFTAEATVRPAAFVCTVRNNEPVFGVRTPGDTDQCSAEDVASAANPLHYVPFVSQVYEAATGDKGSAALKIIGGAVLGGPIGFVAGLASAIYEQESGQTVTQAIASAFTGEDTSTQVAEVTKETPATAQVAQAKTAAVEEKTMPLAKMEILPPATAQMRSMQAQDAALDAQMKLASATSAMTDPEEQRDDAILSLFGGQPGSAHRSYQKAQMLPYLKDVTTSQVI